MKKNGFLLLFLLFFLIAHSEINIGNSVEWLCADAGLIAKGRLISHQKATDGTNLFTCTFETVEILKGSSVSPVNFTIKNIDEDSLNKYISEQTSLLIFMKENEKPFKSKKIRNTWHILETYNSIPALINLVTPQQALITAHTFSVLNDRALIIATCRLWLQKIAAYEILEKTVFMNYLEIPFQSPAFNFLSTGSKCFLTVPDFMFPNSKEKLY
ncbi:MAG TPA: hypothetical protein PKW80_08815 [Bacteroidales bacterium]|nr:hypothetical protein [Bacteroidales bacterium]